MTSQVEGCTMLLADKDIQTCCYCGKSGERHAYENWALHKKIWERMND